MRNLRILRLSIFNKLLKAQDLRNGLFVRVLPEEPIFALIFQPLTLNPKNFVLLLYRRSLFREVFLRMQYLADRGNLGMAVVSVYARHSKKYPKSKEKKAGQCKRCRCPLWLRWGKDGNRCAHAILGDRDRKLKSLHSRSGPEKLPPCRGCLELETPPSGLQVGVSFPRSRAWSSNNLNLLGKSLLTLLLPQGLLYQTGFL